MLLESVNKIVVIALPVVFAVGVHEAAHGFAAFMMGDDTAKRAGRISLNPIRHIDPFGSVLLPLLLVLTGAPFVFGYARPVPINPARFREWKKGIIVVSMAGICANLVCLALSGLGFRLVLYIGKDAILSGSLLGIFFTEMLLVFCASALINAVLAVFNMIPLPPLDGSRIVTVFLPVHLQKRVASVERFGIMILLFLFIFKAQELFRFINMLIMPLVTLALGKDGAQLMLNLF